MAFSKIYLDNNGDPDPIFKLDKHFVEANTMSEPTLYRANAQKLGFLPADLVIDITEFHKNFQEARTWLPRMVEDSDRKYMYTPLQVLDPACDAVRRIVPALRKIEAMAHIAVPAPETLGMGDAEAIIEMEREFRKAS